MLTRILTALIGVVVFFATLALPTEFFLLVLFVVALIMLGEVYSVLKCGKLVNSIGYILTALAFNTLLPNGSDWSFAGDGWGLFMSIFLIFYIITVIRCHGEKNSKEILAHGFVSLYIAVSMTYIARINTEFGTPATLWVFVIAWLCDSGAYFAGVFLGKHKLCPNISPKKTVEGAIGGVLASTLACAVYYVILLKTGMLGTDFSVLTLVCFMAMGLFGAALSQVGDLFASTIKRDSGVKDYGSILPGHGGMMDRFDSVVYIAPFVYYCLSLILQFV